MFRCDGQRATAFAAIRSATQPGLTPVPARVAPPTMALASTPPHSRCRAREARIVIDRNDVLARLQQPPHILVVSVIGRRQHRAVQYHVGVQRQDLLPGSGRQNTFRLPPRMSASIASRLALAIHEQPCQFEARIIQHCAQTGLAHRPGRPLDYPSVWSCERLVISWTNRISLIQKGKPLAKPENLNSMLMQATRIS